MEKRKRGEEESGKHAAKRLNDCDYNSTISVLVGPDEKPFTVHKEIICATSKFFKAACSERWLEGQEKRVKLPEATPDAFQKYLTWIYSGTLGRTSFDNKPEVAQPDIVDLCILGDSVDDVHLRNRAMSLLVNDFSEKLNMDISDLSSLYQRTSTNSPLRRMFATKFLGRMNRDIFVTRVSEFPNEFVQHVATTVLLQHRRASLLSLDAFRAKLPLFLEPTEPTEPILLDP